MNIALPHAAVLIRRFAMGLLKIVKDDIIIPATTTPFITSQLLQSPHVYVWESFRKIFSNQCEPPHAQKIIRKHRLLSTTDSGSILAELGDTAIVSLAIFSYLISLQRNGEPGALSTYHSNNFFIKDNDGELWNVITLFRSWEDKNPHRWLLNALPCGPPYGIWENHFIFSTC